MPKLRLAVFGSLLCFLAGPVLAAPACTLLVEADSGKVLERQGTQCDARNSPASTVKIALAVMGYDSGILSDEHRPLPAVPTGFGGITHLPDSFQENPVSSCDCRCNKLAPVRAASVHGPRP